MPWLPDPKDMERSPSSTANWPWFSTSVGHEGYPQHYKRKHQYSVEISPAIQHSVHGRGRANQLPVHTMLRDTRKISQESL